MHSQLLRTERFWPLFWTQFLGAFNDNFFKNSLVILITFQGLMVAGIPPEMMVPLCGGIFILPYFLFSATAGQLADIYDKASLIRLTKVAEVGIMGLAAVGFWTGQVAMLLGVLFLMGTQSSLFGPCKYSILPQHLTDEELVGGNALVEMGTYLGILLGTLAGGELVALANSGVYVVGVGVVIVAIIGLMTSQYVPSAPAIAKGLELDWNPVRPTRTILAMTMENRTIFLSILGISWFWLFGSAFLSLFPTWTHDVLDGTERLATLFLALFSLGIGLGSLMCEKLSRERLELGLVPIGSFGMTLFTTDLWWIGDPWDAPQGSIGLMAFLSTFTGWRIMFDLVLLAAFGGFLIVPLYTLIQQRSKPEQRSRIIAGNNIWNALFMVSSALGLAGMAAIGMDAPTIFGLMAIANLLVGVYIYSVVPEFMLRFVVWILSNLAYRVERVGMEHIPKEGAAVLVCNHVSFIDWFILAGAIKRPPRFVMDKAFFDLPVVRFLFQQAGTIPICSRKRDPQIFADAFDTMADQLEEGWLVCLFPEGAITHTGEMLAFKPGVEWVVERSPVPVVPMAINGLWGSFFSRVDGSAMSKPFRRGWFSPITVTVGEPIPAEEVTAALLQERVAALYAQGAP